MHFFHLFLLSSLLSNWEYFLEEVWFYSSCTVSFQISKLFLFFLFYLMMFLILSITKFWLLYRFPFSFCWDDFSVSTVLFDNLLFFTIIKFIIYQKIPLRLRNHSSIMRIKLIKKSYSFNGLNNVFEISIFLCFYFVELHSHEPIV